MFCVITLLLAFGSTHRLAFDDPADLGRCSSDVEDSKHAQLIGEGVFRGGGVRPGGGYLEMRGGYLDWGHADRWQVGTDMTVMSWVRMRDAGTGSAVFSLGPQNGVSRCTWSAVQVAELVTPSTGTLYTQTLSTLQQCKQHCVAQSRCKGISYDTSTLTCLSLSCTPGEFECEFTNSTSVPVTSLLSTCSDSTFALTMYVSEGSLGLTWNGDTCDLPHAVSDSEWTLLAMSISSNGFINEGKVRVAVLSPGIKERFCYSKSWFFPAGIPVPNTHRAVIGKDLLQTHDHLNGDIDDFTTSLIGAEVGSLSKQLATQLGVLLHMPFDAPPAGTFTSDAHHRPGYGVKGGSLAIATDSPYPSGSTYRQSASELASLGGLEEVTICAWIKPMCWHDSASGCGTPWAVRSATGDSSFVLQLKNSGVVSHTMSGVEVSTQLPTWVGCFVVTDWVKDNLQIIQATTLYDCRASCSNKYFMLHSQAGPCYCSDISPYKLMQQMPDHKCGKPCDSETSTILHQHCGTSTTVAVYTHVVADKYDMGYAGKPCTPPYTDLVTEGECSGAAKMQKLYNTTMSYFEVPTGHPAGCLYNEMDARLYWNAGGDPSKLHTSYQKLCKIPRNPIWQRGKWQWYCASKDVHGGYHLFVDGHRSWTTVKSVAVDKRVTFAANDVIELGGGGRTPRTQFKGHIDGLRISRRNEIAALEGNQLWRLEDLNRVYDTRLLASLSTGLVEWTESDSEVVNSFIAATVDIKDKLLRWRVRHSGAYVDMSLVLTSSPLVNTSNGPQLHNALLTTYRQEYGNGTTMLGFRNVINKNSNAYAGSCPYAALSASSRLNDTMGPNALRKVDGVPWKPWGDATTGWLKWTFQQTVEVTGIHLQALAANTTFRHASLQVSDDGDDWRVLYWVTPEATDDMQYFTGWGFHQSVLWRLVMDSPYDSEELALDYLALEIAGYSAPCGGASTDCQYTLSGSFDPDIACNMSAITQFSTIGSEGCKDACNDEQACLSFAHHEENGICVLYREICGLNTTVIPWSGWRTWTDKRGCGPAVVPPSSDTQPVDVTMAWHAPSGKSLVTASRPWYRTGGPPDTGYLQTIADGMKCNDENVTSNRLGGAYVVREHCETACMKDEACHYCAPFVCTTDNRTRCTYAALQFCNDIVEVTMAFTYPFPLRAKMSHFRSKMAYGPTAPRCDVTCPVCGTRSCPLRELALDNLLNTTFSSVSFGIRGVFRPATAEVPETTSYTATVPTMTVTFTLPTGTATFSLSLSHTYSLTDTLSLSPTYSLSHTFSGSLTATESRSPTFTLTMTFSNSLTDTYSLSHTFSLSDTYSLTLSPTFSLSDSFTYSPSVTDSMTRSVSVSHSLSLSHSYSQTTTYTLSRSLTDSLTMTQTISYTGTASDTFSLSHTYSVSPTHTFSIRSMTETHTMWTDTYTETDWTETLLTATVSMTVPTETGSDSLTLSPTFSLTASYSLTSSQSVTESSTLVETRTQSATLTQSDTHTLSLSPSFTESLTETITRTVPPTSTATFSETLSPTFSLTKTLSETLSMSLPTVTESMSTSISLNTATPTSSITLTSFTLSLPTATESTSLTESFTDSLTSSMTLTLPTSSMSMTTSITTSLTIEIEPPAAYTGYSVGINAASPYVHAHELALFSMQTVNEVRIRFDDFLELSDGNLVSGNFETSGEALSCGALFCLTPAAPASTGAVHVSSAFDSSHKISVHARFGIGSGSYAASGGWLVALHGLGPVLGNHGTGYFYGLLYHEWYTVSRGVYIMYDGTLNASTSGGHVMVVCDDGTAGGLVASSLLQYTTSLATPGLWWDTWVDVDPSGKLEVYVSNSELKPSEPIISTNLTRPLTELLDGPTWVSGSAASGCGEMKVSAKLGFFWREKWWPVVPSTKHYADRPTEIIVTVKGEAYIFGFTPGKYGGMAQVTAPNGTTLFSDVNIGWTPMTGEFVSLNVTLRTGGVHSFGLVSFDGLNSWSLDFQAYGWWSSNYSRTDVNITFYVAYGYIYEPRGDWWKWGTVPLDTVGSVKIISDLRKWKHAPERYDNHKAYLESVSCYGTQHRMKAFDVVAEPVLSEEPTQTVADTSVMFPGDPARFLFTRLVSWFPSTAFGVDMWMRYSDPSSPQNGLISYTVPFSNYPAFEIYDAGSTWKVAIGKTGWVINTADHWNPLTSLVPESYGYGCSNTANSDDTLAEGTSFATLASCAAFCTPHTQCAACSPYKCDTGTGKCICSYRAMRRCVGTSVMATGCTQYAIAKKESGWVHMGFRWRSEDGCWSLFRDGVLKASGCGVATGLGVQPGGTLLLGQHISAAGKTQLNAAFQGSLRDVRIWEGYPSEEQLLPASQPDATLCMSWPLRNGETHDVSGNNRHLSSAGTELGWTVLAEEAPLPPTPIDTPVPAAVAATTIPESIDHISMADYRWLTTCDVDDDGTADVVAVSDDGLVTWLAGGSWSPRYVGKMEKACQVDARDMDRDGDIDLYAACGDNIYLWTNTRKGVFTETKIVPSNLPGSLEGMCVADVDGDAVDDVLLSFKDESVVTPQYPPDAVPNEAMRLRLDGNTHDSVEDAKGLTRDDTTLDPIWVQDEVVEGVGAAYFDGLRCGQGPLGTAVSGTTQLTWSAWVKLNETLSVNETAAVNITASSNTSTIVSSANNYTEEVWSLKIDYYVGFFCSIGDDTTLSLSQRVPISGVWYHVVCVWDGIAGTLQMYENYLTTGAVTTSVTSTEYTDQRIGVGCSSSNSSLAFIGVVDDIRVWVTALPFSHLVGDTTGSLSTSLHLPLDASVTDKSAYTRGVYGASLDWDVNGVTAEAMRIPQDGYIGGVDMSRILPVVTHMTLALWVRVSDVSGRGVLLGTDTFGVYYDSGWVKCTTFSNQFSSAITSKVRVAFGVWSHVACTFNGVSQTTAVFIDMANVGYVIGTYWYVTPPAESFRVGGGDWSGDVDDVRVLHTCVMPGQMTSVFAPRSNLAYQLSEEQYFDATSSRSVTLSPISTSQSSPRSISLWVMPLTITSSYQCVVSLASPTAAAHFKQKICISSTNIRITEGPDTAGTITDFPVTVTLSWLHIVVVYSGTYLSVYANGEPLTSPAYEVPVKFGTEWRYDNNLGSYGFDFTGWAKDLRVYSTALTKTQAKGLYGSGAVQWLKGTGKLQYETRLRGNTTGRLSGVIKSCVDWDGDDDVDVVLVGNGYGDVPRVTVLANNGVGNFTEHPNDRPLKVHLAEPPQYTTPRLRDFNSDGTPDLMIPRTDGVITTVTSNVFSHSLPTYKDVCANVSCTLYDFVEHGEAYVGVLSTADENRVLAVFSESIEVLATFPRSKVVSNIVSVGSDIVFSTQQGLWRFHRPVKATSVKLLHPIMHLPFADGRGGYVSDIIDGNNGYIVGDYQWAPGGLYLRSARVIVPLSVEQPLAAFTLTLWVHQHQHRVHRTVASLEGVIDLVLNNGHFYAGRPGDVACGCQLNQLGTQEWHSLAVTWGGTAGLRLFIDGRAFMSCGTDYPRTASSSIDLSNSEIEIGRDFEGVIGGLRLYDRILEEAELLGIYHLKVYGNVPKFVPKSVICPATGGWHPTPDGMKCVRAVGTTGVPRKDALQMCKMVDGCDWADYQGGVPASSIYTVAGVETLTACKSSCCESSFCAGVIWDSAGCSLLSTLKGFKGYPSGPEVKVWVVIKSSPAHMFTFNDFSLADSNTAGVFAVVDGTSVLFSGGQFGQACELGDNQTLSATLASPVSYQLWTVSMWVKKVQHFSNTEETRCHWALGSDVYFCQTYSGLVVKTPFDEYHFGTPPRTGWHHYEVGFDGMQLHVAVDCEARPSQSANLTSTETLTLLYVGSQLTDTAGGQWKYDNLLLWPHYLPPCSAAKHVETGLRTEATFATVNTEEENTWYTGIKGPIPAWLKGTSAGPHQYTKYRGDHGCGINATWPVLMSDGTWLCGGYNTSAAALCEAKVVDPGVESAPVLTAKLESDALPEHGESQTWVTVLLQKDPTLGGGYFPPGKYSTYGSVDAGVFLNMGIDWRKYRQSDGSLELRLSWPHGACDGTDLYDMIWRQDSQPDAFGAPEGYRAVDVPYTAINGEPFTGLHWSREADKTLLDGLSHATGSLGYGVGARTQLGCGMLGPDKRGVHHVELSIKVAENILVPNPITVAFWIRSRAEPWGAEWADEAPDSCPGAHCGCDAVSRTHVGIGRRSAVTAAWIENARRVTISNDMSVLPGTVWTCPKDNKGRGPKSSTWQTVSPVTRRYGVFSYRKKGQASPDIAMECEGRSNFRGSCGITVGRPTRSVLNRKTHINSPQLVKNVWSGDEWKHFALTWEGAEGCYRLYLNGEVVQSGCGHNIGGVIEGGGSFTLGHIVNTDLVVLPNTAIHGSLADFAFWSRVLDAAEVVNVMMDDIPKHATVHWPLKPPDILHDKSDGRYRLLQQGAFKYHNPPPEPHTQRKKRVQFPGKRSMALWTGAYPVSFSDGSSGVTVCLWHKSLDTNRIVFSFAASKGALSDFGLVCSDGACVVLFNGAPTGASFNDALLSSAWVHFCLVLQDNTVTAYINGIPFPVAAQKPFLAEAEASLVNDDAWKAIDGRLPSNGTFDGMYCYQSSSNATDWLRVRMQGEQWVASVELVGSSESFYMQTGYDIRVGTTGTTADDLCSEGVSIRGGRVQVVRCAKPLYGTYVSIHSDSGLVLCEVAVRSTGTHTSLPTMGHFYLGTAGHSDDEEAQFEGSLAEVRVWTTWLSYSHVLLDMVSAAPRPGSLWCWWKLDTLKDSSENALHLEVVSSSGLSRVQGRWELIFRQRYPSVWDKGLEHLADATQFAALGRLAEEFRWGDGRLGLKLEWGNSIAEKEEWWQVSDPTTESTIVGFSPANKRSSYVFEGLFRDGVLALMNGAANASTLQYAVGTFSGDAAPTSAGGYSEDVKLYGWTERTCINMWMQTADEWCSSNTLTYHQMTVDTCKEKCRGLHGCTGFSYPCVAGGEVQDECCEVHFPPMASSLVAAFEGPSIISSVLTVEEGTFNITDVPQEMLGGKYVASDSSTGDNTTVAVTVSLASWLYVLYDDNVDGNIPLVNDFNTSWEVVATALRSDLNITTTAAKRLVPRGTHYVSAYRTWFAVVVRGADVGIDGGHCTPVQYPKVNRWALTRDCDSHRHLSDKQCYQGSDCVSCLAGSGYRADCSIACAQDPACNYFTSYEDGWCSLLATCAPFYYNTEDRPCKTYQMISSQTLGFKTTFDMPVVKAARLSYKSSKHYRTRYPEVTLQWSDAFTVEMWMKVEDVHCGCCPVSAGNATIDIFAIVINGGGIASITVAGETRHNRVPLALTAGEWVHVAVSWASATGLCSVVVDGTEESFYIAKHVHLGQGVLRIGQYFPLGIPGTVMGFSGELAHVRIWRTSRTNEELDDCKRQSVGPYHSKLLGAWELDGTLNDTVSWNEVRDVAWSSASTVSVRAYSSSECSSLCSASPTCKAWKWDGACSITSDTTLQWTASAGSLTGRFRSCANLHWNESRKTALNALPHPLPAYSREPWWWYFNLVYNKRSCAAACNSQPGCTAWTWLRDSNECYGVKTPAWGAIFTDDTVSGSAMGCFDYPSVAVIPLKGGRVGSIQHMNHVCGAAGGRALQLQDEYHLQWLSYEVFGNYSYTGSVPVAYMNASRIVNSFDGRPMDSLFSNLDRSVFITNTAWNTELLGDTFIGLDTTERNLTTWAMNSTDTEFILCESVGVRYGVQDLSVSARGSAACRGNQEDTCSYACQNGHCESPVGPCVCHANYYPPDDCSQYCVHDLSDNKTDCVPRSPELHVSDANEAVSEYIPTLVSVTGSMTVPILHTSAFHLKKVSSEGYRIKVVRSGGRGCRVPEHPASPTSEVTFVGVVDTSDECAELVDARYRRVEPVYTDVAYLWSIDGKCYYAASISESGAYNSTYTGCLLTSAVTTDMLCASRPHTTWIQEPAVTNTALRRGRTELVYHVTAEKTGSFLMCYQPAVGNRPWLSTGFFTVRPWTCAEKKQLVPSSMCVP